MDSLQSITVREKELVLLDGINKYCGVDSVVDPDFLTKIFKVGLVSMAMFFGKQNDDLGVVEASNEYMASEILSDTFTFEQLKSFWEEDEKNG